MKDIEITVLFDNEKFTALQRYMQKKDLDLNSELTDIVEKLYEKHVPAAVREYIAENSGAEPIPKKVRKKRTPLPPNSNSITTQEETE